MVVFDILDILILQSHRYEIKKKQRLKTENYLVQKCKFILTEILMLNENFRLKTVIFIN